MLLAQGHPFVNEISLLQLGKSLPRRNPLRKLRPFLDEQGILRVGGRLTHSTLPLSAKHPPILNKQSHLSQLFIKHAHCISLHGGPTLTRAVLNNFVWILGATGLVKQHVRNCITCHRVKPPMGRQLMGDLPHSRITPARPFSEAGLDYAGPFQIRAMKGRGHQSRKAYIALFICFTTRAIHLEAVGDLSTNAFLNAFQRFASRRGVCHTLHSDNGTNFVGADKELKRMFSAASEFYGEVAEVLENDGTTWKFIPAHAPHFGGLWEAGVKSTKHHLRRAFGDLSLTFEEFSTALAQIEACLNSRPLCPLSSDPEDLHALTPAHFLIGSSLHLIPDFDPPNVPENRLSRFQLLQRVQSTFWHRWSNEYLHHLQERNKWREPEENFAVGQLVIIQDDRYPPAK